MLVSLLAAMSMVLKAETIGDFEFGLNYDNKTATLIFYNGSSTEVVIPESVTYNDWDFKVTSLGGWCFSNCETVTSITIPSSVTSLESYCFENCSSLTSINIPESVTSLGFSCFYGCSALTSITIPESVKSLDSSCFENCN